MVTLLSKLFIKNSEDKDNSKVRHAYAVLCSLLGVVFNNLRSALRSTAGAGFVEHIESLVMKGEDVLHHHILPSPERSLTIFCK